MVRFCIRQDLWSGIFSLIGVSSSLPLFRIARGLFPTEAITGEFQCKDALGILESRLTACGIV